MLNSELEKALRVKELLVGKMIQQGVLEADARQHDYGENKAVISFEKVYHRFIHSKIDGSRDALKGHAPLESGAAAELARLVREVECQDVIAMAYTELYRAFHIRNDAARAFADQHGGEVISDQNLGWRLGSHLIQVEAKIISERLRDLGLSDLPRVIAMGGVYTSITTDLLLMPRLDLPSESFVIEPQVVKMKPADKTPVNILQQVDAYYGRAVKVAEEDVSPPLR